MAVIQISRIQVRRGVADLPTESGLPQLAGGEIGWAVDTQKLWIGSGSIDEGAPQVENVEVLTRKSLTDILLNLPGAGYSYRINDASGLGYGATERTIQEKLDDRVSAKDFGIVSGSDVTVELQTAIDSLYKDHITAEDAPVLEFPPAEYLISSTILLPSNAKLEGVAGRTKFTMVNTQTAIFQTAGVNNFGTYTTELLIQDSVKNVSLKGLVLETDSSIEPITMKPLVLLDKVRDSKVENCAFIGPYQTGAQEDVDCVGVQMRYNNDANNDTNVIIENNRFENVAYGVASNDRINGVTIRDSKFYDNYRSVTLASSNPTNEGPQNILIENNWFDKVFKEAIYVGTNGEDVASNIVSSKNVFRDVGNETNGLNDTGDAKWPVITFKSRGNTSVDDNFERFDKLQPVLLDGSPDSVPLNTLGDVLAAKTLIDGRYSYTHKTALNYTVAPSPDFGGTQPETNTTAYRPLLVVPVVTSTNALVTVDYILNKTGGISRTGQITAQLNTSTGVAIKDVYTSQNEGGDYLYFIGENTNNSLVLKYLISSAGTITLNVASIQ